MYLWASHTHTDYRSLVFSLFSSNVNTNEMDISGTSIFQSLYIIVIIIQCNICHLHKCNIPNIIYFFTIQDEFWTNVLCIRLLSSTSGKLWSSAVKINSSPHRQCADFAQMHVHKNVSCYQRFHVRNWHTFSLPT